MRDRDSLALRAQIERIRSIETLRAKGLKTWQAVALTRWREQREEQRMREPWALRETHTARHQQAMRLKDYHGFTPEPVERQEPSRWAMYGAAVIVAAFAGVVLGVAWLIVTHGAKVLGRLGL
jgi:hypothetical protein